jgi:hypothetical protein
MSVLEMRTPAADAAVLSIAGAAMLCCTMPPYRVAEAGATAPELAGACAAVLVADVTAVGYAGAAAELAGYWFAYPICELLGAASGACAEAAE